MGELRYKAWGETRYTYGTTPTTYRYTGQREQAELGLYYYGARWYDQQLGRWISPDTIVPQPGNPQSYNRYSYVNNSPAGYRDPSGHASEGGTSVDDPYTTTGEEEYGIKPAMIALPPTGMGYDEGRHEKYTTGADATIEGIVMHKTAGSLEGSLSRLRYSDEVSAHFVVDTNGDILQLVGTADTAWHAGGEEVGDSSWTTSDGTTHKDYNVNAYTIGIEVVGQSGDPYTAQQRYSTGRLVEWLAHEFNIDPENIVSHAYVTPGNSDGGEFLMEIQASVYQDRHGSRDRGAPAYWY